MASDYPTTIPAEWTQGDTLQMALEWADSPAGDGWALTFVFSGSQSGFTFSNTGTENDAFLVSIATPKASWIAGDYKGQAYVEKDGVRKTVWRGNLTVLPAYSANEVVDTRTHNQKVLASIKAVLEGTASREILQSSIEGQTLQWIPYADLLKMLNVYEQRVANDLVAERVAQGLGSGRKVYVRFNSPA